MSEQKADPMKQRQEALKAQVRALASIQRALDKLPPETRAAVVADLAKAYLEAGKP